MAQHITPNETNYPARLHLDDDAGETRGRSSSANRQPTTERRDPQAERPVIPIELAQRYQRRTGSVVFFLHHGSMGRPAAITPTTHPAAGNCLTAANLAKTDTHYDPGIHEAQRAAHAHALQKAGKEQGFDLPAERYMPDRQDLAGWLAQQSK